MTSTSSRSKQWRVSPPPPASFHIDPRELFTAANGSETQPSRPPSFISPGWLPSRLLFNRAIKSVSAARSFLNPTTAHLKDPFTLPDMETAANTLVEACRAGQSIGICGDFDVDGLSGTAVIVQTIRALGGTPLPFIPHREQEGHGVALAAVHAFREAGARLMITVDTGTSDIDVIAAARAVGIATIITDHHLAGPGSLGLPPAVAIVNPHRVTPEQPLSGSGVAFKLAQAACSIAGVPVPEDALAFAALGTIADSVPLRDDNRIIVRFGLEQLGKTKHPGLRALLDHSRAPGANGRPDTELVSFYLGPRLNSAGRLGDAGPSLRLLIAEDPGEAEALASSLDALNSERQRLSAAAWEQAEGQIKPMDRGASVIVVTCESVLPGLLGPLAGKLCELHRRPAIAMTTVGGAVRASARSVPGFDIHAAIASQSALLDRFGGHARAAGFTARSENIGAVLDGIERHAAWASLTAEDAPEIEADCEARVEELGVTMWDFVQAMSPFGEGNPAPVLISRGVQPAAVKTMGTTGRHLRLTVEDNGRSIDAVGFGLGNAQLGTGRVDIAYRLRISNWAGRIRRELDLKAIRPSA